MQRITVAGEAASAGDMIALIQAHRAKELAAHRWELSVQRRNHTARMSDYNRTLNYRHYAEAQIISSAIERLEQRIAELEHTEAATTR